MRFISLSCHSILLLLRFFSLLFSLIISFNASFLSTTRLRREKKQIYLFLWNALKVCVAGVKKSVTAYYTQRNAHIKIKKTKAQTTVRCRQHGENEQGNTICFQCNIWNWILFMVVLFYAFFSFSARFSSCLMHARLKDVYGIEIA